MGGIMGVKNNSWMYCILVALISATNLVFSPFIWKDLCSSLKSKGESMNYKTKKVCTYSLIKDEKTSKDLLETFQPIVHDSVEFKNWIAILTPTTCPFCRNQHGKIYYINESVDPYPPVHNRCKCRILPLNAVNFGNATKDGINGVDMYLNIHGQLPYNYISKKDAIRIGWINILGNLQAVAPGKTIGGDVYKNRNNHLPSAEGRVWYEADINYDTGYRNDHRIIYSNDGLVFATYNHYMTFVQIH